MRTWWLFLIPVLTWAGAGTNGGSGSPPVDVYYNLLYGTFSLGGSSFDYLATDVPQTVVLDSGDTALTDIDTLTGLDSRVYEGLAVLMTAPPGVDDIAFSTGGVGEIADVTDPSEIIAEAIAQGAVSSASETTSSSIGSELYGTVTSSPVGMMETTVDDYYVNLKEVDFNGVAPAGQAAPEPGSALLVLAGIAAIRAGRRKLVR